VNLLKKLTLRVMTSTGVKINSKFYSYFHRGVFRNHLPNTLPSVVISPGEGSSSSSLMNLVIKSAEIAQSVPIKIPDQKLPDSVYFNIFPGEHYRLLRGLVSYLMPKFIIEIGTFTGMGTVALLQGNYQAQIDTFDIVPWNNFESHLSEDDFSNFRLRQNIADLSQINSFNDYFDVLNRAELIFLDGPKDGVFEYTLAHLLTRLDPLPNRYLVIDDIRFVNMIELWDSIQSPKVDAVTFGHFTGTGICDISKGLKIA